MYKNARELIALGKGDLLPKVWNSRYARLLTLHSITTWGGLVLYANFINQNLVGIIKEISS